MSGGPGRALLRIVGRLFWVGLVVLLPLAFAAFVWPTRWRYDHMTVDGEVIIVRIDRLSDYAEMLLPDEGWVPVQSDDATPAPGRGGTRL